MGRTIRINPAKMDLDLVKIAAMYIRRGGLIVYPTDTLYGFGVDVHNEEAMKRLYSIKRMKNNKPVSLLVRNIAQIETIIGGLSEKEKHIIHQLTPGKVTLILSVKQTITIQSLQKFKKIGFRIPDYKLNDLLVTYARTPISSTSVNISRTKDLMHTIDIDKQFGSLVDLFLDAGNITSRGSSIIDTTTNPPTLLREGDIAIDELQERLGYKLRPADVGKFRILFVCSGNICRSPTAEGILKQMLGRTKYKLFVEISSAGTLPYAGVPAAAHTITVANQSGIDLHDHISQTIDQDMMEKANLIICMALNHYQLLNENFPQHRDKIVMLKQWKKKAKLMNPSVADPIGHRFSFFEKTYQEILSELKRVFPDITRMIKTHVQEHQIEI